MTRYREWWSARAGAIVWTRTVQAGATAYRVLPDGCQDLIWVDGALIVAGPDTTAQVGQNPAVPATSGCASRPAPARPASAYRRTSCATAGYRWTRADHLELQSHARTLQVARPALNESDGASGS